MDCPHCLKPIRWYHRRMQSSCGRVHMACFFGWLTRLVGGDFDDNPGMVVRSEVPLRGNNLGALIGGTEGVRGVPVRGPRDGEDNGPYDL
jgi:hypothetical protein